MNDSLTIKWMPRKINLDIKNLDQVSPLYEGETIEDFQLEKFHKKGAKFNINHKIKTKKYGDIMFIAPNPIEFYIYGAKQSLEKLNGIVIDNSVDDLFKGNSVLFEGMSFVIYLCSALEALINQKIPKTINIIVDKRVYTDKSEVEKLLSIEDKIKHVVGLKVGDLRYWTNIKYFIRMRNDIIHLKTTTEISDFKSYEEMYIKLYKVR